MQRNACMYMRTFLTNACGQVYLSIMPSSHVLKNTQIFVMLSPVATCIDVFKCKHESSDVISSMINPNDLLGGNHPQAHLKFIHMYSTHKGRTTEVPSLENYTLT